MLAEAALCMALTVYHEARGEPYTGRVAVAHVLRNRAEKYDTSICWEAFRYRQFSWTRHPSKLQRLPEGKEWKQALDVATHVLHRSTADFTGGADHFHLVGEVPSWARGMKVLGRWGDHVFYASR